MARFTSMWNELSVSEHGIILKGDNIVIPSKLKQQALEYAHEGHASSTLTKRLLRNICYWPGMDNDIENMTENCITCQVTTNKMAIEPLLLSVKAEEPWHTIAIDFGSMPTTENILNVYDESSRKLFAMVSKGETINICQQIFSKYGVPKVVKSDNGPAFKSKEFCNFAKKLNFVHRKVTPLHPQANGAAERKVQATSNFHLNNHKNSNEFYII